MSPFFGATDTPILDFWWRLLWVSKPEWAALFKLGRGIHVTCSLRFTSGVTPADLLVASKAAEPSLPHTCKALVGLKPGSYHATVHSVRSGRPDALLTELFRLGYLLENIVKKPLIFFSIGHMCCFKWPNDVNTKKNSADIQALFYLLIEQKGRVPLNLSHSMSYVRRR